MDVEIPLDYLRHHCSVSRGRFVCTQKQCIVALPGNIAYQSVFGMSRFSIEGMAINNLASAAPSEVIFQRLPPSCVTAKSAQHMWLLKAFQVKIPWGNSPPQLVVFALNECLHPLMSFLTSLSPSLDSCVKRFSAFTWCCLKGRYGPPTCTARTWLPGTYSIFSNCGTWFDCRRGGSCQLEAVGRLAQETVAGGIGWTPPLVSAGAV